MVLDSAHLLIKYARIIVLFHRHSTLEIRSFGLNFLNSATTASWASPAGHVAVIDLKINPNNASDVNAIVGLAIVTKFLLFAFCCNFPVAVNSSIIASSNAGKSFSLAILLIAWLNLQMLA